jgi:hypothetical protein
VPAPAGAGRYGEHDPRRGEHLLGGQPPDRRVGRGAAVRRAGRGVVRPAAGGGAAAAARAGQAPGGVPARHRLAGAQAGGVRGLPLPAGPVPLQPLPHGLRRAARAAAGAGHQGVFGGPLPVGAADGGRGGGGAGPAAGRGPAAHRRGRGGGAGQE